MATVRYSNYRPKKAAVGPKKVLHSFGHGTDGTLPRGGVVLDAAGNLYGTTFEGGIHGVGTAFELSPQADGVWTETVLHSFNGADGWFPEAGLIFDTAGNLYGTTGLGGIHEFGTVFELSPREGGGWAEKVLHSFNENGVDGSLPYASLIFDVAGNLYGTTYYGGIHTCEGHYCGTVFELSPKDGGWSEKLLHSFGNGTDGTLPQSSLAIDAAGNLYGTTYYGGIHAAGVAFELSPREGGGWTETVLHSFGNGNDGADPQAGMIYVDGNLYGTTYFGGGEDGFGTVFEITP